MQFKAMLFKGQLYTAFMLFLLYPMSTTDIYKQLKHPTNFPDTVSLLINQNYKIK